MGAMAARMLGRRGLICPIVAAQPLCPAFLRAAADGTVNTYPEVPVVVYCCSSSLLLLRPSSSLSLSLSLPPQQLSAVWNLRLQGSTSFGWGGALAEAVLLCLSVWANCHACREHHVRGLDASACCILVLHRIEIRGLAELCSAVPGLHLRTAARAAI